MKPTISFLALAGLLSGALFVARRGHAQFAGTGRITPGVVAAHLVGRLLVAADGTGQLYGYYPFIEGLPGPFFAAAPGEASAYFTFRSAAFQIQIVPNGNILHLFSTPINDSSIAVTVYYNASPNQDFNNPASFSAGQPIAMFRTRKGMATAITGASGVEIGTLDLVSSANFTFQGQTFNLQALGRGITLTSVYAGSPASGSLDHLPASVPFGGTATAIGGLTLR